MKLIEVNRLRVSLDFGQEVISVGDLLLDNRKIYFKYDELFLDLKLEISPFKLKNTVAVQLVDTDVFDGLFGVFADSLPDGWGRLLIDRKLTSMGEPLSEVNPLSRLAIIGNNGPGALVYHPIINDEAIIDQRYDLDDISAAIQKTMANEPTILLDELFKLGGSTGGARPKINVGFDTINNTLRFPKSIESEVFEPWIIKFASSYDPKDIANIEYAYYLMAQDAGLKMNNSKLFLGKSGNYYFGTKRFDREGLNRKHLHSVAGLLHDNFRLSSLDYGHIMDCAFILEKNIKAYESILRLAAFNVFSNNRDDHSKNISFLMDAHGSWEVAPPYDITFSNSAHGYHSMTIAGEGKNPGEVHLKKLGDSFGVKNIESIIDQVKSAIAKWPDFAKEAFVTKQSINSIYKILKLKI